MVYTENQISNQNRDKEIIYISLNRVKIIVISN